MCGIVAVADIPGAVAELPGAVVASRRAVADIAAAPSPAIARALAALAHRGPDDRGTWTSPDRSVTLGHTRLAVVDPAGGAQPIANEDGTVVAIVNGEIYDDAEIARALAARGHTLRSRCDAELIVHLYEDHGVELVRHVRGELAFVLWDMRRQRLVAARDRFGIKPLVWARHGGGIALASEAKALFELGIPAGWDDESFFHAAHVQYPWPDRTLFRGVHVLEPGCTLVWTRESREPAIARYWRLRDSSSTAVSPIVTLDEAAERLRSALADSVRARLRADARVCVQLSGGLDSSSVAALANAAAGIEAAFTVAFVEPGEVAYDERAIASATAAELGMRHVLVELGPPDIARDWVSVVAHSEGLAINGHLVGKYHLSRAMRDAGFKVALTGEGADELLAGYPHLRIDGGATIAGHRASRGVMLPSGDGLSTSRVRDRLGFVPTWMAAKASLGARVRELLSHDLLRTYADVDPFDALVARVDHDARAALHEQTPGARLHTSAETWMRTALAHYILRVLGDGMEMAHSIEGRVPFLDPRIAELAMAIDPAILVGTTLDKPVLRRAMAGLVPRAILDRPKHPFLAPPLAASAPELVQDTLRAHAARSPLVDRERLLAVLDALPAMSSAELQRWDPALMLLLSAAVVHARYIG